MLSRLANDGWSKNALISLAKSSVPSALYQPSNFAPLFACAVEPVGLPFTAPMVSDALLTVPSSVSLDS